jgi:hypothetical protein
LAGPASGRLVHRFRHPEEIGMKRLRSRSARIMAVLAFVWAIGTAVTMASPAFHVGVAQAAQNPCNPCSAGAAKNPCNPCNQAQAAKAGNPCNPCAAKAGNPCNPCAVKAGNPCNPCAVKAANPCNPCAAKR